MNISAVSIGPHFLLEGPWSFYEEPRFGLYGKRAYKKRRAMRNERVREVVLNVSDT